MSPAEKIKNNIRNDGDNSTDGVSFCRKLLSSNSDYTHNQLVEFYEQLRRDDPRMAVAFETNFKGITKNVAGGSD